MRRLASWLPLLAAIGACSRVGALPVIAVTGGDYALIAPDSVSPGPTRLRFANSGTVAHELAIARVKSGVAIGRVLDTELKGGEVEIQKKGEVLILRPKKKSWATFFESLGKFSDDFMATGRKRLPVQQRKRLFP